MKMGGLLSMFSVVLFATSACGDDEAGGGGGGGNTAGSIKIGAAFSFTGPLADRGLEVEQASDLALKHINAGGGVLGKSLSFIKKDTQANPEICTEVATSLIQDEGVKIIVGAIASSCTDAILNVTVPAGVLTASGVSFASSLTVARDNKGLFFRTSGKTADTMGVLAEKMIADGNTSVAIVASDNKLTASAADDLVPAFEALDCGGSPCEVAYRHDYSETIDVDGYDFASDMATIMAHGSDAIFFAGYPDDGLGYLRAALDAGYTEVPYISVAMGHAIIGDFLPPETAAALRWIDVAASSGRSFEYFRDAYETAYNTTLEKSRLAEQTYDMVMVLALAINKAGVATDPQAVSQAIYEVANPPGEIVYADEYAKMLDMITAGTDIDYEGASGKIDFDDMGDIETITEIMGYTDGAPAPKS